MITIGLVALTLVWIQAHLSRCLMSKVLWAVEDPFVGYNHV